MSRKAYIEHERSRVKTDFQCMHTAGGPAPSLHRESTDSLIVLNLLHATFTLFNHCVIGTSNSCKCSHHTFT